MIGIAYVGGSDTTALTYDGLGRLTQVVDTISGTPTTTRYTWCGERVCQKRNGSDVIQKRYYAEGESWIPTSENYVYQTDQIGSVRDVQNASTGARVKSYDYTPYGITVRNDGAKDTDFRYAGMLFHPTSSLYFTHYRAYDPKVGRWLNRDPIGESDGFNLYAYVKGNPISYTDPSGLCVGPLVFLAPACPAIGTAIVDTIATVRGAIILGSILPPIHMTTLPATPHDANVEQEKSSEEADDASGGGTEPCPGPEDLRGKTPQEVDAIMKEKGWTAGPSREGGGTRYTHGVKGEQVRVQPGKPTDPNPVKQGPYARISKDGIKSDPIPLVGNPTLE